MKVKDWQKAAQLVHERQNQAATTDTSELSSFFMKQVTSGPKWTTQLDTWAICPPIK